MKRKWQDGRHDATLAKRLFTEDTYSKGPEHKEKASYSSEKAKNSVRSRINFQTAVKDKTETQRSNTQAVHNTLKDIHDTPVKENAKEKGATSPVAKTVKTLTVKLGKLKDAKTKLAVIESDQASVKPDFNRPDLEEDWKAVEEVNPDIVWFNAPDDEEI